MDKLQKHDYMNQIESFLEEKQVYELFEDMLKQLVVCKPENPLDYIVQQLSNPAARRVFFCGMPGSNKNENAMAIADEFQWKHISMKEVLLREEAKKSEDGRRIADCLKNCKMVDDDIVIRLIKQEVDRAEEAHSSWIISGFPRTKVQSLSLQKLKVIPDKFVHLNVRPEIARSSIKQRVLEGNPDIYGNDLDEKVTQILCDYNMHMDACRSSFKQFIFEFESTDMAVQDVTKDLLRMLKLRYKSDAPRRPPRVILLGPPGSGRTTQAQTLCNTFGLVSVSPVELLKQEAEKNPGIKIKVREAMENGDPIPDEIILRLVDARLRQSDCRVNGWVLDGFPENESQVNLLRAMHIKASLVVIFEQPVEESVRRLNNKRVDPSTGCFYNMEVNPPTSEIVNARLVQQKEDQEGNVRKRFVAWNTNISALEEAYKDYLQTCPSDKMIESVADQIAESIQNLSR